MKNDELKRLIAELLDKIEDEKMLRLIYRYINDLYCRKQ